MLELVLKNGDPEKVVAVACEKCCIVSPNRVVAELCCKPKQCAECGNEFDDRPWTACRPCRDERDAAKDVERYEKATKVSAEDYKGRALYCELHDEYSFDDLCGKCEESEVRPDHYWACTSAGISVDADSIIENACEEHHEDAYGEISRESEKELQEFLDAWCAKQSVATFYPDFSTAVLVTWPKVDLVLPVHERENLTLGALGGKG